MSKVITVDKSKPSFYDLARELLAGVFVTLLILPHIPWGLVFANTIPGGGDNPAHPVLMRSIAEAFFQHLSVVHYSYRFWCGFEMFQFYFPLPYLIGAALSLIIPANIAFKVISLSGILALPVAFYIMGRFLDYSRWVSIATSLLAIPFVYTESHSMWGANVSSTLAGMIGNSWAFVFFPPAFGAIVRCFERREFSRIAVIISVLATLCHFYALLMLGVLYATLLIVDLVPFRRAQFSQVIKFQLTGICTVLIMCWWILPLLFYRSFSSDFGSNWNITLLDTFPLIEKIFVCTALIICTLQLLRTRFQDRKLVAIYCYFATTLLLYFGNRWINSPAFIDVRLWPSIYFLGYVIVSYALNTLAKALPVVIAGAACWSLMLLIPNDATFGSAITWMQWNFEGIEKKPGGEEFIKIVQLLKAEPPARISFESSNDNNARLGSVRTFEILPYLTDHEIVEGGIVNSATFPGIPYFLQCLSSNTCAGWPNGSIMPGKDFARAVEMMRELGVSYHIAASPENIRGFKDSGEMIVIYEGRYLTLIRLNVQPSLVEVFDSSLPVITVKRPHNLILNFPRWDTLRQGGYIFNSQLAQANPSGSEPVNLASLFNFLVAEWSSKRRVADRSFESRKEDSTNYLNSYLFSWRQGLPNYDNLKLENLDMFIADRGFDPDVFVSNQLEGYSEVLIPLMEVSPSGTPIRIDGKGYEAFSQAKPLLLNTDESVFSSESDPSLGAIILKPIHTMLHKYVDTLRKDAQITPGLPGSSTIPQVRRITDNCNTSLEKKFHQMELRTTCPGKPHIIKYSYFPKWHSSVPISVATNGFMALTPSEAVTVLHHDRGFIDLIGIIISLITLVWLAAIKRCW